MMDVNIYIASTWSGPRRSDGVAMWLIEYEGRQLHTRQGFIHMEDGTEAQGCLRALINAFSVLTKSCSVRVFTECGHILHTTENHWHRQWEKNNWCNAKGKPVKNPELWQMFIKKTEKHMYSTESGKHPYTNVMQMELERELSRWRKSNG